MASPPKRRKMTTGKIGTRIKEGVIPLVSTLLKAYKRNLHPKQWAKFLAAILVLMLAVSCELQLSQEQYTELRKDYTAHSNSICKEHGQSYVVHHTPDLEEWEVICYQPSPARFFHYELGK